MPTDISENFYFEHVIKFWLHNYLLDKLFLHTFDLSALLAAAKVPRPRAPGGPAPLEVPHH